MMKYGMAKHSMVKRFLLIGLSLALAWLALPALGEETAEAVPGEELQALAAEAVTIEELQALAGQVWGRAAEAEPLNDPAGDDAKSEDGIAHLFTFGTVYAEGAQMTAETDIRAFVLTGPEDLGLRELRVDDEGTAAMARFPTENPTMAGTRERAVLYLQGDAESGFRYGLSLRDGQRMTAAEYGEFRKEADGSYSHAALQLLFQRDLLTGLSVTGLKGRETRESAEAFLADLQELKEHTEYIRYPRSLEGTDLTAFGEEDLRFGGLNFAALQPEDLPEVQDRMLMEDDGADRWLLAVHGEGYEAVFSCEAEGKHPKALSLSFLSENLEGPRGVRLGDFFHEDFNRFRHGENETDGQTELLYGRENEAPFGMADYADGDGMTLRYTLKLKDGRVVELYLHYIAGELTEMMLNTL